MSKILPYSLIALLGALIFYGSYTFVLAVNESAPELHLSIKTFTNTTVELQSRADTNAKYKGEPIKLYLNSSQFFSNLILPINKNDELAGVRIDFDNQPNNIMIEKAYLISKISGERDTIKIWKGAQLEELVGLYNNISVETRNESYIQLKSGETDPYIEFNSNLLKAYKTGKGTQSLPIWLRIFAASLITFTLLMLFRVLFKPNATEIIRNAILNGKLLYISFFIILFVIFFNNQWNFFPDISNKENRKLASKPSLTAARFFEYPELYTKYAKDNYSFRNFFFFVHSVFKAKVLRVSPLPDDEILGKKDWFFDNEPNVIKDFRKLQKYDGNQLFTTTQILLQRKNWLNKHHIKFYVIIPPNKNRVYPELMPDAFKQMEGLGHNYLDLLTQHLHLHSGIDIIDPTKALLEAKKKLDVYYSTDTHWNLYGGFIGYQTLIKEIAKDFPSIKPVEESEFDYASYFNSEGDLAKMCGLQDVYKRKEYVMKFKDTTKELKNPQFSSIDIHYNNTKLVDSSHLKLVMFRDSYSNYLIPFLNLHFKEANYIWSYEFLDQVIEREKPDVVIFESLQRFMSYALTIPNSEKVVKNE